MWPTMLKYLPASLKCADPDLNKNKGVKRKPDKQFKICQIWGKSKASQVTWRPWNLSYKVKKKKKMIELKHIIFESQRDENAL